MIAALDVDYREDRAVVSCVEFAAWTSGNATWEGVVRVENIKPYEPGAFYKRELPCLLAALNKTPLPNIVLVDGYVWLDNKRPGLGAYLHKALAEKVIVVGVAKSEFLGAHAIPIFRGDSVSPLWVSAAGMETASAALAVSSMHGPFRIPTLIKRADTLCRTSDPDMSQPTCKTCKHWAKFAHGVEGDSPGHCGHPENLEFSDAELFKALTPGYKPVAGIQPLMWENEFCGHHEPS